MANRSYASHRLVRDGMELLRWRCEPRDWQHQLDHARARDDRRERHLTIGSLAIVLPWVFGVGYGLSLISIPLALSAGFALPVAAAVGVAARKRWYPARDGCADPPLVMFTSTGLLINEDIARPWRGAGYRLVDARVSDDVNPWVELTFRDRWRMEIYELPVPTGLLKAAMEITEMLRAKGQPIVRASMPE